MLDRIDNLKDPNEIEKIARGQTEQSKPFLWVSQLVTRRFYKCGPRLEKNGLQRLVNRNKFGNKFVKPYFYGKTKQHDTFTN